MSNKPSVNQERIKANMLALLYAIIKRELSYPHHRNTPAAIPRCPRCRSRQVTKRGHDAKGRQRYDCKSCERSFTTATGSAFSSTNIPLETWFLFAECFVEGKPLRATASRCDISLKTAFFMRKRLNRAIDEYSDRIKHALHPSPAEH